LEEQRTLKLTEQHRIHRIHVDDEWKNRKKYLYETFQKGHTERESTRKQSSNEDFSQNELNFENNILLTFYGVSNMIE